MTKTTPLVASTLGALALLASPAPSQQLLRDITPGTGSTTFGPKHVLGDRLIVTDGRARTLWVTDGTPAGTQALAATDVHHTAHGGNVVYFRRFSDPGLYKTDGTDAGTSHVVDSGGTIHGEYSVALGDVMYFRGVPLGNPGYRDVEVWRTDGTAAGTYEMTDLARPGGSCYADCFWQFKDQVVFTATVSGYGEELWISDGTRAGTRIVKDINPGFANGMHVYLTLDSFVVAGDRMFFEADDGVHGKELWVSDGTPAGTNMVVDISSLSYTHINDMTALGDRVIFEANPVGGSNTIWVSDGTTAGSFPITEGATGFGVAGGLAFFRAWTQSAGYELWVSDGTPAGSRLAAEIQPGTGSGCQSNEFVGLGDRYCYFVGDDGVHGAELWVSDGTAAGTRMVADLEPGSGSSNPTRLVAMPNGKLVFEANTSAHGRELWVYEPDHARTVAVGQPCGRGNRQPTISAPDPILGTQVVVQGDGATQGALAMLLFGHPAATPHTLGAGCVAQLDRNDFVEFGTAPIDAAGRWSLPIDVPNVPALIGVTAGVQAAIGPTDAPLGGDLTNALYLTAGN